MEWSDNAGFASVYKRLICRPWGPWANEPIAGKILQPAQKRPFPVKPSLQKHSNEPTVLLQLALKWQLSNFSWHSSTSDKKLAKKNDQLRQKYWLTATLSFSFFRYSPIAQVSPLKPEGHTHWKLSSDSKFGMHEAFLGHGPLEHEFYKKGKGITMIYAVSATLWANKWTCSRWWWQNIQLCPRGNWNNLVILCTPGVSSVMQKSSRNFMFTFQR